MKTGRYRSSSNVLSGVLVIVMGLMSGSAYAIDDTSAKFYEFMKSGESVNPEKALGLIDDVVADTGWELEKESKNIQVYTKATSLSPIKSFLATREFDSPAQALAELLFDASRTEEWLFNSMGVDVVESMGPDETIVLSRTSTPWPFKNRDSVLHMRRLENDGAYYITMVGLPERMAAQKGFVRIPLIYGFWKVTPLSEARSEVEYHMLIDPALDLPSWLINTLTVDSPFESLLAITRLVEVK